MKWWGVVLELRFYVVSGALCVCVCARGGFFSRLFSGGGLSNLLAGYGNVVSRRHFWRMGWSLMAFVECRGKDGEDQA
jgi:hypothetical protein